MQTDQIKNAVKQTEKDFGRIDIRVNNASLGPVDDVDKTTDEMWHKMIDTNLNGIYFIGSAEGHEHSVLQVRDEVTLASF
jgi:NAD(P)-dependent dehydrogenase (short-subunit alcohol dehydrogenase family)